MTPAMVPEHLTFRFYGDLAVRTRFFLMLASVRHLAMAAACWFASISGRYTEPITALAPFWLWGAVFCAIGLGLMFCSVVGNETWARVFMLCSVCVTLYWGVCFAMAWLTGLSAGPFLMILTPTLALKDIIILSLPFRLAVLRIGD